MSHQTMSPLIAAALCRTTSPTPRPRTDRDDGVGEGPRCGRRDAAGVAGVQAAESGAAGAGDHPEEAEDQADADGHDRLGGDEHPAGGLRRQGCGPRAVLHLWGDGEDGGEGRDDGRQNVG